jgi:hypothetical protein
MKILSVAAVVMAGCGTIFSGTSQQVNLIGIPQDAHVTVDGGDVGQQRQVTLKRGRVHAVVTERPGCRDGFAPIEQNFNGVSVFNLFCPLCWLVDVATGAVWDLDDQVVIHQDCRQMTPVPGQAMIPVPVMVPVPMTPVTRQCPEPAVMAKVDPTLFPGCPVTR